MRLAIRDSATEYHGEFDSSDAVISNKNKLKLFATIFDALYSDKIGSSIREIVTNAYEVSPDNIDIHLPNMWEPVFSVRDYGPGLSHQFMMNRMPDGGGFLSLGHSTKDHSNEAIGGLGYGCKAPFSVVHQYNITSYQGGEKRVYVVTFDRVSIPNVNHLTTEQTTEADGLKVSWDVPRDQHRTYRAKLEAFVGRMPTLPNVSGNQDYNGEKLSFLMEGDGWGQPNNQYPSRDGKSHAVMGIVAYPINKQSLGDLTPEQDMVLDLGLDIHFPIGSLDIAHSRESLGYDDVTIKRIKRRLDKIASELTERIKQDFAHCSTLWEARKTKAGLTEGFGRGQYKQLVERFAKFDGQKIDTCPRLSTYTVPGALFFECDDSFRDLKNPNLNNRLRDTTYVVMGRVDGVIYIDDPKGAARKVQECEDFKHPLVVGGAPTMFDKVHEFLGHPPYKMVSDLPKPAPRSDVKNKVAQFKRFVGWHWADERRRPVGLSDRIYEWSDANVNLSDSGYYVPIFGSKPCLSGHAEDSPTINADKFTTLINTLRDQGVLPQDVTVYGLPATYKKLVDKPEFKGWTNIFTLAEQRLETLTNDKERQKQTQTIVDYQQRNSILHDGSCGDVIRAMRNHTNKLSAKSPIRTLVQASNNNKIYSDDLLDQQWRDLSKLLRGTPQLPEANTKAERTARDEVLSRYPLLKYLDLRAEDAQREAINYCNLIDQT
jgi:hypothetical protein